MSDTRSLPAAAPASPPTGDAKLAKLRQRVRAVRSRATVRAYELRQLPYARGVWFRLRRLLVDAERVLLVEPSEVASLLAEGYGAEALGGELVPPKTIICIPHERGARLDEARAIAPSLRSELLMAPHLVLVRFASRG